MKKIISILMVAVLTQTACAMDFDALQDGITDGTLTLALFNKDTVLDQTEKGHLVSMVTEFKQGINMQISLILSMKTKAAPRKIENALVAAHIACYVGLEQYEDSMTYQQAQEALQLIYDEKLARGDEEEKEEPKENGTEEEGATSSVSEPPVVGLKDRQDGDTSPSKISETLMYFGTASVVALFVGYIVSTYTQTNDESIKV